jgi:long-subunit fatty acid transport protein
VNSANGIGYKQIESDPYQYYAYDLNPAWWTFLLDLADPKVDSTSYISPVPNGVSKIQTKAIDSWGSMNEYDFSLAFNIRDRFYLGMTWGIPYIRYYESSNYAENNIINSDLNYFNRIEGLETHGTGFNFKMGVIYRASDWLRLGAAFHTPSWFSMRDYWSVTMISQFNTPDQSGVTRYVRTSPSGTYDYSLQTPYRIQGNLAFIIGNIGLVSADYEFADYATSHFNTSSHKDPANPVFAETNNSIKNGYTGSHSIRVGTEWRYQIFSFRAGGKYFTSPYKNNINDGSRFGFSAGIGLKQKWFFIDLAYAYAKMNDDYYFYNTPEVSSNPVANSTNDHYIVMTLGAKL